MEYTLQQHLKYNHIGIKDCMFAKLSKVIRNTEKTENAGDQYYLLFPSFWSFYRQNPSIELHLSSANGFHLNKQSIMSCLKGLKQ